MKRFLLSAVAASALFATAAHANLLTNGSFEDTAGFVDQGNHSMNLVAGSTAMTGWTVIHADVYWIGDGNPYGVTASPSGGSFFLDLSGNHNGDPTGGITQTIATTVGATYLLTFDLGSEPNYTAPDGLMATAGSTSQSFVSTGDASQHNFWESESLSFTATDASTAITLLGNLGQNYVGLDNVSVTFVSGPAAPGVPEPASWALMLVGFAGLGSALRRRSGLSRTTQGA